MDYATGFSSRRAFKSTESRIVGCYSYPIAWFRTNRAPTLPHPFGVLKRCGAPTHAMGRTTPATMDFSFDFGQIYLVVLCGALALPLLLVGCRFVVLLAEPHLRAWVAQFNYAKPRLGGIGPRVSGSQLSILILYLAINGVLLGVGIDTLLELERRAAAIASANLMLVFLGGRTNPLADFMQIPLASYYFGHRWIGIVATCEALLHSGLALSRRQKQDASLVQSGYIVSASVLLPLLLI